MEQISRNRLEKIKKFRVQEWWLIKDTVQVIPMNMYNVFKTIKSGIEEFSKSIKDLVTKRKE